MPYELLAVLAAFAFLYSVVASRLERTPLSGAVVYLFAGLALGPYGFKVVQLNVDGEGIKLLAEITLALVLFSDSANSNLGVLRKIKRIPERLLLIGLPLTILAGFGVGWIMFDELTLFEIALLATMLAPTDAALGQAVVTNESVPASVRESLNVESGLNDGICVPVLLIFLALATNQVQDGETAGLMVRLPLQAIGIGALVGMIMGVVGAFVLKQSYTRQFISGAWTQVPIVALALFCFAVSQWLGGSGFIGSFVGGLVFGGLTRDQKMKEDLLNGAEGAGNIFGMLTWFIFGAVVFGRSLQAFDLNVLVYAILSLTVIRMLPVFLCLIGTKSHFDTKSFIGWFGPRGLASIVFVVMVLDEKLPGSETLSSVVAGTVALSIIAHGLSAVPLANWYGKAVTDRDGAA